MDGMFGPAAHASENLIQLIAGHAARVDRSGSFPRESLEALNGGRLLAVTARRSDGGEDAGLGRVSGLVQAVGKACASTGLILGMQLIHLRHASRSGWPEHLISRIGRGAGDDGSLINALRVEPALGTPARGGLPATTARRVKEGWAIDGRKIYSTGAPGLAFMLVFARTDDAEPRTGLFLVPGRGPGVRIEETWDQLGLRGSGSHDVVFEDVRVPEDHAVDLREPAGWKQRDDVSAAWSATVGAALYTGVAEAAPDWTVHFLRSRTPANLGAPLATLPRMQEAVGRIEALLHVNERLIAHASVATDAACPPSATESGLTKTVAAENAIEAVEVAVKLAGNHGLSRANPLERHLRDVLCARVHTPQPDTAYAAAGRLALAS